MSEELKRLLIAADALYDTVRHNLDGDAANYSRDFMDRVANDYRFARYKYSETQKKGANSESTTQHQTQ